MNELNPKDILKAPSQLMFFIFTNVLLYEGNAKFSEHNNKVILLNGAASNYFSLGRDNKMVPYIAIQEDMIPWFFEINWVKICISFKDGYIYLVSEENNEIKVVLGLKPRKKRMITLFDPKNENIEDMHMNMKVFKIINKDMAVSKSNISEGIEMKVIDSVCDIIDKEEEKEVFEKEDNDFIFLKR